MYKISEPNKATLMFQISINYVISVLTLKILLNVILMNIFAKLNQACSCRCLIVARNGGKKSLKWPIRSMCYKKGHNFQET